MADAVRPRQSTLIADFDRRFFRKMVSITHAITIDDEGDIYFVDSLGPWLKRVTPKGNLKVVAGCGMFGYKDGPCLDAKIGGCYGIMTNNDGSIHFSQMFDNSIRTVRDGRVITLWTGSSRDFVPGGITLDPLSGRILIANEKNGYESVIGIDDGGSLVEVVSLKGLDGFSPDTICGDKALYIMDKRKKYVVKYLDGVRTKLESVLGSLIKAIACFDGTLYVATEHGIHYGDDMDGILEDGIKFKGDVVMAARDGFLYAVDNHVSTISRWHLYEKWTRDIHPCTPRFFRHQVRAFLLVMLRHPRMPTQMPPDITHMIFSFLFGAY